MDRRNKLLFFVLIFIIILCIVMACFLVYENDNSTDSDFNSTVVTEVNSSP